MAKATLIGEGNSYTFIRGKTRYKFEGEAPTEVPPSVGVYLQSLNHKGKPLFKVSNMPKVINKKVTCGVGTAYIFKEQQRLPSWQ